MKQIVIFYGNCQAGVLHHALAQFDEAAARFESRYVMSFQHPTQTQTILSPDELGRCALVLRQIEQQRPLPAWLRDGLPAGAPILTFPPLDLNLLWPLNVYDPRNVNEPPDYPFGRFPYGDRVVVELLREGLAGQALWEAYQERSVSRLPDLGRLAEIEGQRLAAREATADVRMAALVMANYTKLPLFWTINHPTSWLMGRLFAELLHAARNALGLSGHLRSAAVRVFETWETFDHQHQPIHPEVAQRLGLQWWSPDRTYRYFDGSLLTFETYMRRYIDFV